MAIVKFKPVTESEVRILGVLRQKAWAATYRGIYPDAMIDQFDYAWHEEKDLLRLRNPQYRNWFIERDDEKVGYLTLKQGEFLLVQSLYLLPQAQKQGIGKQAFAFIRRYCSDRGIQTFRCYCQPENCNAIGFYEKMGGVVVGQEEGNAERWQDSVIFAFETSRGYLEKRDEMHRTIRCAETSDYNDAEVIMKEVQQLHVTWRPDIYKLADTVYSREYFDKLVSEKRILVAEEDGHVVGLLSFMYRHVESDKQVTRNVIFVDDLAVKEEYRGKGIGTQLLKTIKERVKAENLDGLELQVNARNTAAQKMYEKFGFTEKSINMELL